MTQAIATRESVAAETMERVLVHGDLSKLTPAERLQYYRAVCESVGLNVLTRPFSYIILNGKLTLYALKDCTDQLRRRDTISIQLVSQQLIDELYVVTARGTTPDGRSDEEIGVVALGNLKGEARANAMMKAVTKAKRRVTLSICGLGWLDETEVETIADARPAQVDYETGELVPPAHQGVPEQMPILASPQQLKAVFASAREHGWSNDDIRHHVDTTYAVQSSKDLTRAQASELLQYIAEGKRPAVAPVAAEQMDLA